MKKKNFSALAMMGISMGLVAGGCQKAQSDEMSPEMRNFYEQLTPDAQKKFKELDDQHKKASMGILNSQHACRSESACKGMREQAVEEQYQKQMKGKAK
jgi:hypothetical protein